MKAIFTRPSVNEVFNLAQNRIYLTANPLDNLWQGKKRFKNRAFKKAHPNPVETVSVLPDHTLTYWPKYTADWRESEASWRTMEFIYYDIKPHRGDYVLVIRQRPVDRLFLMVHGSWRTPLVEGRRSHQDLYAELWRSR